MQTSGRIELARKIVTDTDTSLFLTGKAGTGKTTFLRDLRSSCRKRMIVTAPTGIAAINAGGVTLHSFFQLDFGPFIPGMVRDSSGSRRSMSFSKEKIRLIRGLDLLVIDEVSMVRADLLDAVDDVLRRYRDRTRPFGGVQLLLIGDLQQLPPVVRNQERPLLEAHYKSPYFFDSHALGMTDYLTLELTEVYRQNDSGFISLLNSVRENNVSPQVLGALNSRYVPDFTPEDSDGYIRLTTHNHLANEINAHKMEELPTTPYRYEAVIEGTFPESAFPGEETLILKEGAQVMFIKNDLGPGRQYFNGMLGTVTAIDEDGILVTAADTGDQIEVLPAEWENVRYVVNEDSKEIETRRDGVFRQLPLRPAWAITIHKSQGLTFDHAIIDASAAFAHGQTYVALSRCRSLEGLVLERPLTNSSVIADPLVSGFMNAKTKEITRERLSDLAHAYRIRLIESLFNFRPLYNSLEGIVRILKENFMRLFPKQIDLISRQIEDMRRDMTDIGDKFCRQVQQLDSAAGRADENPDLIKRIKDACRYFGPRLIELNELVNTIPVEHDNKKVAQKLQERLDIYHDIESVMLAMFETFCDEDFSPERYLDVKASAAFRTINPRDKQRKRKNISSEIPEDTPNPKLFDILRKWRKEQADIRDVPAFQIASTKILMAVAAELPLSNEELLMLSGIGPSTAERIGASLISIVKQYIENEHIDIDKFHSSKTVSFKKRLRSHNKGETYKISLDLWNSGKSIDEIASERGLALSTIESHILRMVDIDDLMHRRRLVSEEHESLLRNYYQNHPEVPADFRERMEEIERFTGFVPSGIELKIVEHDFPDMIRVRRADTSDL